MLFYKGGRGILLIKAKNAKAYKKTRILYAAPFWGSGAKSYMWYPISRFVLVRNLRSYFYQALIRTWIPFLWKFNEFLRQKTCIPWQQDIVATPDCHIYDIKDWQAFETIRCLESDERRGIVDFSVLEIGKRADVCHVFALYEKAMCNIHPLWSQSSTPTCLLMLRHRPEFRRNLPTRELQSNSCRPWALSHSWFHYVNPWDMLLLTFL